MIFVDSGAWYASACPEDENHRRAREWLAQNEEPLLTTDYVIDETLTLFRARGNSQRAIQIGTQFFAEELATVHFLTPDQISSAWGVFRDFADKKWSFTDCTSKVVIESLGVMTAFSFDRHFRQFGAVVVVPPEF